MPAMVEERVQRRLVAILAADVVGYSRLMGEDETGTLAALKSRRKQILDPLVGKHQGRTFKVTGDGVLVQFGSAVDAVACAIDLQQSMANANADQPENRRIVLRIGINLGDVIVEGSDLYGDGINIASRLEGIAEPGCILVSSAAYEQIKNKVPATFADLGPQKLRNIDNSIRVYQVADTPPVTLAAPKRSEKPTIAVLPLHNMSGDEAQSYFSDGITEDIITELSRFRQLHVLARNSSFQYRGQNVDVVRVGRELGAQYVVEGSMRRIGDRIRITAQLVETDSGCHIWAERYDRTQDELFTIQDEVVRTIVATLAGRIAALDLDRVKRKPPANLAAYECVLRGDALPIGDPDVEMEALKLFERAVELDPVYGKALALLGVCYGRLWLHDMSDSNEYLDRALDLARKGLAADPNDPTCHASLGWVSQACGSYDLAEHHYLKAVELNPNRANGVAGLAEIYCTLGKPEEALEYLHRARQIDPYLAPSWYWPIVGVAHFVAERYDEAVFALNRSPNMPMWVHAYLAACHGLKGDTDSARWHAAEVMRMRPDFTIRRYTEKDLYKREEDRRKLTDGLRAAGLPE
ncbi:MAG TPA: adenylate/guanylate cyclase domain-containing protein [Dongiaceae bacterium]